jgi:serine/threonine protein kinase
MTSYRTIQTLGRGGFGIVEEVENASGERLAKKTFSPAPYIPPAAYDKLRKRFKREVSIQEQLGGNEVLPILGSNLSDTNPWFVMPLAERTYDTQIADDRTSGSIDIDAIAEILNGLQYLHDLGYVHRDLNPKNILLHDGHWKLSDLGAVLPPTGHTVTLTEGTVIFTEQYCAPEQRNDFHTAQSPADIYSFGCILHDIYGTQPRTPYAKHTAAGTIGLIVEKCTEPNPARRPSLPALRGMLLDTLVELGGHCKVVDPQSEEWLKDLDSINSWDDEKFQNFVRFFAQLDTSERSTGFERDWVHTLSTPFLTKLPTEAMERIASRTDGHATAIVEKYCEWARNTPYSFPFADIVCQRLNAIFDNGTATMKATAFVALLDLAATHNRFYVMRCALHRAAKDSLSPDIARRLAIEIRTEEAENSLRRCVNVLSWSRELLAPDIAKLCEQ